ncbi:hypothetical protein BC940DRAFT_298451 [Gongronella butleri]|nr:hypothetical protein BC940DRAFT_298451 [Gongronella butleri]
MGKKKSTAAADKKTPTTKDGAPSKKSAADEIDDIFSGKTKSTEKTATEPTPAKDTKNKKKKDTKKETSDTEQTETDEKEDENKVQEVVFSELAAVKSLKRKQPPPVEAKHAADDAFADSRGKKSKRLTDDGYPLYDVKDLRIGEGEDTPECPFDCQCCF